MANSYINVNKLKGKIVENGMSIAELAEKMNIDKSTLYRKLDPDGGSLLISDANKIVEILNLGIDDATAIFFSKYVA